uniref:Putative secreted protein n=1 Tax=Ixodes ricinus TaxID=34613 RepID=A0A6B0UUS0_IXORI
MAMRDSFSWMFPKVASLLPNWALVVACSTAFEMDERIVPHRMADMPKRPLFRMCIATLKPSPTWPSTFSTGTGVSSKLTVVVLDALMPIFFSGGPEVTPPKPRSTMNAVMRSFVSPDSIFTGVCANTVKTSAMPPLLIHILPPLRM